MECERILESVGRARVNHFSLPSPILLQRLIATNPIGGTIKERNEDFLVDEIPLIDPSGQGEHLHMGVQKSGLTHDDLLQVVAKQCGVPVRAIGYAGMKDRQAVTRQTISVHLPGLPDPPVLSHPSVQVLWSRRHDAKLRPGQLQGNRFSIRIRGVDPLAAPRVLQGLRTLEERGAPNAFGRQRFGNRCNNHVLGALLAAERWSDLLAELCGAQGSPFPPSQQEARACFDAGDFRASERLWARGDFAERAAVRAMAQGRSPKGSVLAIKQSMLQFWMNATQSAGLNAVLSARLELGLFDQFVAGDVANLHPGRSLFRVHDTMLADSGEASVLARRLKEFDCSPTGPMIGESSMTTEQNAWAIEEKALHECGLSHAIFAAAKNAPAGERRSLRMKVSDPQVEAGVDVHGGFIRVAFDLPRGGFATAVLTELMGSEPAVG